MPDFETQILRDKLSDYDGKMFLYHKQRNEREIADLSIEVKKLIEESEMPVSVANGFLDYMKLVIGANSYLRKEK